MVQETAEYRGKGSIILGLFRRLDQGKDPKKIFERIFNRKSNDSSLLEVLIKTAKNRRLGRREL